MNLVEFGIQFKDLASTPLGKVAGKMQSTMNVARQFSDKVVTMNRAYSQSYNALQQRISEVEDKIRNSTIKSEIRAAKRELESLQKQSNRHSGNIGSGSSEKSGGGLSMGGLIKGNIISNAVIGLARTGFGMLTNFVSGSTEAYEQQAVAETRLAAIMGNTMNARKEDVQSILQLASAQQKLGVIGDEVQLSGAQELSTYLTKADSLKKIMPVMNDMLAQQYGLNASQEQAQNIATMLGKVMDGQVGALSRYGYKFNDAQEKILKYGTEAQRVSTLVDVVSASVGGVNAELAKTPEGMLKQQQNRVGDLKESIGKIGIEAQLAFSPLVNIGMSFAEKMMPLLEGFIEPLQAGVGMVAGLIETIVGDTSKWSGYLQPIGEVFKKVFTATIGIVTKIVEFIKNSELLKDIFSTVGKIINGLVDALVWVFDNVVMPILNAVETVYRFLKGNKAVQNSKNPQPLAAQQEQKEGREILQSIAKNTAETRAAVNDAESGVKGGGQKIVTFNIGKFFENINIQAQNVTESAQDIERVVLEVFGRVLTSGAVATL